jgi:hypothetical protein
MFGLPILEVAIGLSFVYLLLALICSTLNETIAGITGRRADVLEEGINSLLGDDPDLKKKLYDHPLIASLAQQKDAKPSYLSASKFALALMDIVTGDKNPANDGAALRQGIQTLLKPSLRTSLLAVLADSNVKLPTDQQKIEAWYDEAMDRVSGWYKRHTHMWIWMLAVVITLGLDADSVHIFKALWTNQAVRTAVVESAKRRSQGERPEALMPLVVRNKPNDPRAGAPVAPHNNDVMTEAERAEMSDLLVGWKDDIKEWGTMNGGQLFRSFLLHIVGWLFTVAAVSLGAPFWFDTLNRFMNIRSAGRAPDEPRDKSSPASAAPAAA